MITGFVLFSFLINLSFVSAYYFPQVRDISQGVVETYVDVFEPVLQALFGGDSYNGELLFEKLLIFLILISLIYVVLGKIEVLGGNKNVRWIISILVPLLGVRFMDFEIVNTIVFQYGILGVVLSSILPFIIYFFFLHNVASDSSTIRKMGWILFIIIYIGLWSTTDTELYGGFYFWTMIASAVFLFLDGTIHRYYIREQMRMSGNTDKWQQIASLRRDISQIQSDMRQGHIPDKVGNKLIKKKQTLINSIYKYM